MEQHIDENLHIYEVLTLVVTARSNFMYPFIRRERANEIDSDALEWRTAYYQLLTANNKLKIN